MDKIRQQHQYRPVTGKEDEEALAKRWANMPLLEVLTGDDECGQNRPEVVSFTYIELVAMLADSSERKGSIVANHYGFLIEWWTVIKDEDDEDYGSHYEGIGYTITDESLLEEN